MPVPPHEGANIVSKRRTSTCIGQMPAKCKHLHFSQGFRSLSILVCGPWGKWTYQYSLCSLRVESPDKTPLWEKTHSTPGILHPMAHLGSCAPLHTWELAYHSKYAFPSPCIFSDYWLHLLCQNVDKVQLSRCRISNTCPRLKIKRHKMS